MTDHTPSKEARPLTLREIVNDWSADDVVNFNRVARLADAADLQPGLVEAAQELLDAEAMPGYSWVIESQAARREGRANREVERMDRIARARIALDDALRAAIGRQP